MRRTSAAALVMVTVLAVLAGCSPAVRGIIGVRLDATGNPVAVLGWCEGDAAAVEVHLYRLTGKPVDPLDGPILSMEMSRTPPKRQYEEVPLSDPPTGWRVKGQPLSLDESKGYEIRAWNTHHARVNGIDFHVTELRDNADSDHPILVEGMYGTGPSRFVSADEFRQITTDQCRRIK